MSLPLRVAKALAVLAVLSWLAACGSGNAQVTTCGIPATLALPDGTTQSLGGCSGTYDFQHPARVSVPVGSSLRIRLLTDVDGSLPEPPPFVRRSSDFTSSRSGSTITLVARRAGRAGLFVPTHECGFSGRRGHACEIAVLTALRTR